MYDEKFENLSLEQKLQMPFLRKDVQWMVGNTSEDGSRAVPLGYVDARLIAERLDVVFGVWGWGTKMTPIVLQNQVTGFVCDLTVKWGDKTVTKSDVGELNNVVGGLKGAATDAFKRAAVQLGIGRYLYCMNMPYIPLNSSKKYFMAEPILPASGSIFSFYFNLGYPVSPEDFEEFDPPVMGENAEYLGSQFDGGAMEKVRVFKSPAGGASFNVQAAEEVKEKQEEIKAEPEAKAEEIQAEAKGGLDSVVNPQVAQEPAQEAAPLLDVEEDKEIVQEKSKAVPSFRKPDVEWAKGQSLVTE